MAAFRIGQRVRIVSTINPTMAHLVGREDVIVGFCGKFENAYDLQDANRTMNGVPCSWCAASLAPIQPSSHQVTTWAALAGLWQPEHLRGEVVK